MTAYYNEIDGAAADWLEELIADNLIAPGIVDRRSIKDVEPADLRDFTQCHFFAGVSGWSRALRNAGWPDTRPVWSGSCPCQPFSSAGKGEGTGDARHLWPDWFRLICECRPDAIFGEQVGAAIRHGWLDLVSADLEGCDYAIGSAVVGAHSVGAPHIRQRLFFVADSERKTIRGEFGDLDGAEQKDCGRSEIPRKLRDTVSGGMSDRILVNAIEPGLQGHAGNERDGDEPGREPAVETGSVAQAGSTEFLGDTDRPRQSATSGSIREAGGFDTRGAGPVNGHWAGSDWVLTRPVRVGGSPSLRPVESKSQPLAHGLSGGVGHLRNQGVEEVEIGFPLCEKAPARVMRLRGYGNAICVPVATEFIQAYMELEREEA